MRVLILYNNVFEKDKSKFIANNIESFSIKNNLKVFPIVLEGDFIDHSIGNNYYDYLRNEVGADALLTFSYEDFDKDSFIYHLYAIYPSNDSSSSSSTINNTKNKLLYSFENKNAKISKQDFFDSRHLDYLFCRYTEFKLLQFSNSDLALSQLEKIRDNIKMDTNEYKLIKMTIWGKEILSCITKKDSIYSFLRKLDLKIGNDTFLELYKTIAIASLLNYDSVNNYSFILNNSIKRLNNYLSQHKQEIPDDTYYYLYINLYKLILMRQYNRINYYNHIESLNLLNINTSGYKVSPNQLPNFINNIKLNFKPSYLHDVFLGEYYKQSFDYHFYVTKNFDSINRYSILIDKIPESMFNISSDSLSKVINYYNFYYNINVIRHFVEFGLYNYTIGKDSVAMNMLSWYINNNKIDSSYCKRNSKSVIDSLISYRKILYRLRYKHNFIDRCFNNLNQILDYISLGIMDKKQIKEWVDIFRSNNEKLKSKPNDYLLLANRFKELEDRIKANK